MDDGDADDDDTDDNETDDDTDDDGTDDDHDHKNASCTAGAAPGASIKLIHIFI